MRKDKFSAITDIDGNLLPGFTIRDGNPVTDVNKVNQLLHNGVSSKFGERVNALTLFALIADNKAVMRLVYFNKKPIALWLCYYNSAANIVSSRVFVRKASSRLTAVITNYFDNTYIMVNVELRDKIALIRKNVLKLNSMLAQIDVINGDVKVIPVKGITMCTITDNHYLITQSAYEVIGQNLPFDSVSNGAIGINLAVEYFGQLTAWISANPENGNWHVLAGTLNKNVPLDQIQRELMLLLNQFNPSIAERNLLDEIKVFQYDVRKLVSITDVIESVKNGTY